MKLYITLNTVSELVCLLISILCLYREKDKVWRNFILFLFITCLTELTGIYVRKGLHRPNFMVYNVYIVIECIAVNYFFYHLLKGNEKGKKLLTAWYVAFLLFYFIEL